MTSNIASFKDSVRFALLSWLDAIACVFAHCRIDINESDRRQRSFPRQNVHTLTHFFA